MTGYRVTGEPGGPGWAWLRCTLITWRHYHRQAEHGATLTVRTQSRATATQLERDLAEWVDWFTGRTPPGDGEGA
jgi:hypothetical protein